MRKIEFIDLLKSRCSQETFDGLHPEIVSKWIAVKFNNLFTDRVVKGLNLDGYSRPYDLDVANDPLYGYSCTLPVDPLVVPGYRSGIYRIVSPRSSVLFLPVESNASEVFHLLDVASTTQAYYYSVSNGKIIFDYRKWDPLITTVKAYIILSFESYDDDDDVDIPDGRFIDQLVQLIIGSPPVKEINDNAKTL